MNYSIRFYLNFPRCRQGCPNTERGGRIQAGPDDGRPPTGGGEGRSRRGCVHPRRVRGHAHTLRQVHTYPRQEVSSLRSGW